MKQDIRNNSRTKAKQDYPLKMQFVEAAHINVKNMEGNISPTPPLGDIGLLPLPSLKYVTKHNHSEFVSTCDKKKECGDRNWNLQIDDDVNTIVSANQPLDGGCDHFEY